jgi:hypothetical protein
MARQMTSALAPAKRSFSLQLDPSSGLVNVAASSAPSSMIGNGSSIRFCY